MAMLIPDGNNAQLMKDGSALTGYDDAALTPSVPANLVAPSVSGEAHVGSTITCDPGSWSGWPRPDYSYQWREDGSPIGTDAPTYDILVGNIGSVISCDVTATNSEGSAGPVPSSNSIIPVPATPVNTTPPVISPESGTIGAVLSVTTGQWTSPTPLTYAYAWKLDAAPTGDTGSSVTTDAEGTWTCDVTASNVAGDATEASSNSATISAALAPPVNTQAPSIPDPITEGVLATVTPGLWTGNPTPDPTYEWFVDSISVGTGTTYTPVTGDVGKSIRCDETGTNTQGSATAQSNAVTVEAAPVAGDATFGALTLVGLAAVPIAAGDQTVGEFTVSGGMVSGNTTPLTPGETIIGSMTITVVAGYASANADQTEIETTAAAASSGQEIHVRDGSATGDRVDLSGMSFAPSGIVIKGENADQPTDLNRYSTSKYDNHGTTIPGFDLEGAFGITVKDMKLTRSRDGGDPPSGQDAYVVMASGGEDLHLANCLVWSDPLSTFTPWTEGGMSTLIGFGGLGFTDFSAKNCYFHDLALAYKTNNGLGSEFEYNLVYDCAASFGLQQGIAGDSTSPAGFKWNYNRCCGVWSHGGGLGQTGPNNPGGDPGLYPYDWGDPHGSLHGTGGAHNGFEMIGNIMLAAPERRRTAYAGTAGEYDGTGSGPKWNDPSDTSVPGFINVSILHNILQPTDNVGIQIAYMVDSEYAFNTMFLDENEIPAGLPSVNYQAMSTGNSIHHNVSPSYATASGAFGTIGLDSSLFTNSHENLCALPIGLGDTTDGWPMEYGELFDGPSFGGLTLDTIEAALQIKPGGRLDQTVPLGATAYFDFSDNTVGTIPAWTKPVTTTSTGVAHSKVIFDTGDISRITPFPTFSNTDEMTIMIGIELDASMADGEDINILQSSDSSIWLRRLPSASYGHTYFRLYWKDNTGAGAVSLDTSMYMKPGDGYTVWTFSVKLSTCDVRVMKGTEIDPFVKVAAVTNTEFKTGNAYHNIFDWAGEIGFLYISDEFIDLHDQTALNKVIALDGLVPAMGADGSTVTGTQPEVYVTGNAAAWNDGGGLNLGSAVQKYAMFAGAVDDETPAATVPAQMGSPTVTATGTDSVSVDLAAAPDDGGSAITSYDLRWQPDGGGWTEVYGISDPETISGLNPDTLYHVGTRAVNAVGPAASWSPPGSGTTDPAVGNPELMPDPNFNDLAMWQAVDPEWTIGGGKAVVNHTVDTFKGFTTEVFNRPQVDASTNYTFSVTAGVVTTHTGRVRIFRREQPYNLQELLYDTDTDGKLTTGQTFTTTFTSRSDSIEVGIEVESVTATNQFEWTEMSLKAT